MAFLDSYHQQVTLLIRVIPFVAKEDAFALKGGTAINLFVRDMPRLSVDIDLTYLPVEDRAASLAAYRRCHAAYPRRRDLRGRAKTRALIASIPYHAPADE